MIIPSKNLRAYSALKRTLPAKLIRNRFLDYFIEENHHQYIKPSSVLPQFDSSIPFVNAGMCQFKDVFTGEEKVDYSSLANSQKCIRIGGKHNDVSLVGTDSYHHTFFEMLGNWSFGSYSKKLACSYAWELLTSPPFSIPPHRLFVTYFGGDKEMGLPADEDVREIWLEIGLHPSRVLPFSVKENFWEMGITGPCGSCTEIHVALTDEVSSRSDLVNGDNPLLAELWNIVFINFNKTENGIERLPREFIDTGMGFERLVALLQRKTSNYDTDLFQPFFRTIEKIAKCPPYEGSFGSRNLDFAFRRLADFSRMLTIAIADNAFPDINAKVRRILRNALYIAANDFKQKSPERLLVELTRCTAESLSETYPEIGTNLDKVKLIIADEALLIDNLVITNEFSWKNMCCKYPVLRKFSFIEYPGLPNAYTYLLSRLKKEPNESNQISPDLVVHLYNTYGLDRPVVEELITDLNLEVNWDEVENVITIKKTRSRKSLKSEENFESILWQVGIKTDDSWKHKYKRVESSSVGRYSFPEVKATVLAILKNKQLSSISANEKIPEEIKSIENAEVSFDNEEFGLILDKTNFSYEENRRFDKGCVTINNECFSISRLEQYNDFIVHYVPLEKCQRITLKAGMEVILSLDSERRLNIMRNNTLTHLILFALRSVFPLSYLQYDNTENTFVNLRLSVHGPELNLKEVQTSIEKLFLSYIRDGLPVEKTIVPTKADLLRLPGLKLRPCWIYPSKNIALISIFDKAGNVIVREPSSNVHVHNLADLEDCCILYMEKVGEHILSVTAFTGAVCTKVIEFNKQIASQAENFGSRIDVVLEESCPVEKVLEVSEHTQQTLYELLGEIEEKKIWVSLESQRLVDSMVELEAELAKRVNRISTRTVRNFVKKRMRKDDCRQKCVVYFNLLNVDDFKLREFVTKFINFEDVPVLFISYISRRLRGYCHVPPAFCTENFNSEIWMQRTLDKTGISFKIAEDGNSYPGFSFLSHVIVKPSQIGHVRRVVLDEGVNIANKMLT